MAGQFNQTVRPKLAGSYFNWEAEAAAPAPVVGVGGIVAIPLTHNWGPLNAATLLRSPDEWTSVFGGSDTAGKRAVFRAFRGEGRPGRAGAGAVLAFRMGAGDAAEATVTLDNTTPVDAVTFTARYNGTRGNDLRLTVQAGAVGGTKDLLVLLDGRVIEEYPHAQTDLAALVADVNDNSGFLSAALVQDGVALANVASTPLAGGDDGDTLTGAEHTTAQAAFNAERFSVVAPANVSDDTIRTSYVTWQASQNIAGKRFELVTGGAPAEAFATGNTRSQAINDPNVVNLIGPNLHDDIFDVDVSTAELAPLVAGSIANRGEKKDLMYARFAGLSVPEGVVLASIAQQEAAYDAGSTVFSRDTHADAPVFIREGVTTYSDDSDSPVDAEGEKTMPVVQYRRIKNIRIQHGIELEIDEWATSGDVLGNLPVNERTRALVIGRVMEAYRRREEAEIVQPGWTVELDPAFPVSDDDDFVFYRHGFHPTRTMRQMFHTARVG